MILLWSALASLFLVGLFVQLAKRYGWGKAIRRDGPESHLAKEGTPTMGGLAFLAATFIIYLLFAEKTPDGWALLALLIASGLIGWYDDIISLRRKARAAQNRSADAEASTGLLARYRFTLQVLVALAFAIYAVRSGHQLFDVFWLDALGFTFIITGAINAVNFSDGLDGLAGGMMVLMLLPFFALGFTKILIGSLLGFLWYNSKPARVFMGGVGSESLGAVLAGIAILSGWVWWLPLIALVPVLEVLSVVIQVSYFRATGGKRIFKMSPLHHHFELSGWSETQVVMRFWIITAVCVALALSLRGLT